MGVGGKAGNERLDSASRVILAPPRTLFRAFVDREMLASWRAPDGMSARIERFDPRIGGGYRIVLSYLGGNGEVHGKTSPGKDVCDVRFLELAPDHQIIEEVRFVSDDPAFAEPMTLTTRFEPVIDGTKVTVTARDVPAAISPEDHQAGIASSLRNLARLTE
jgi:uncharacterized protein YndB with AHSA1/START domain